ncbi:MAG: hypothetical protein M1828_005146 [Chrysothrix sp. TS-e1954]|nr:MAG: hypothetical protein M1828_005146 [Chrysothrix sp. TS-e1954]
MAAQKKAPTDEELSAMFEGIGGDEDSNNNRPTANNPSNPPNTSSNENADDDPLAELAHLAAARPSSRANTPGLSSSATSDRGQKHFTPTSSGSVGSGRSSEEKPAGSESELRVLKAPQAPSSASQQAQQSESSKSASATGGAAGAGWWGGITSMASAAVKQAKGAVEEIQKNEEAMKWAEQVQGNYGMLRGLGGNITSRALPTFTTLLHHLAPPISQHERLQIHTTHDLSGYPNISPLIHSVFSRVMAQVEGGDLLVIQRGSESAQRRDSEAGYTGSNLGSTNGWRDGPWWRTNDSRRNIGAVNGLVEGTKLVKVSAETYASEFYSARGGLEEVAKQATANLSESNPVRRSDIFLAIQAINHEAPTDLFASSESRAQPAQGEKNLVDEPQQPEDLISFAIYLHDPIHSITFSGLSQAVPRKWTSWMDASSPDKIHDGSSFVSQLPAEIEEIIQAGGVDPREWIAEWLEEVLTLAVGVVAQKYVARRMGVGEGGIGRGKRREEVIESGGGEAARAI